MAENKEYITLPSDKGTINVSEDVVAYVAGNAVNDTEGVASVGKDSGEIWGMKPAQKGVRVINEGETVRIEVSVMAKAGASVHKLGTDVQEAVTGALESICGVKVSEVNVHVLGVQLSK